MQISVYTNLSTCPLTITLLITAPTLTNRVTKDGKESAEHLKTFAVRVVSPSNSQALPMMQDILSKRKYFAQRVQASREKAFQVSEKKNSRPLLRPPSPVSTGMPLAVQQQHFAARIAAARQRTAEVTKQAAQRAREARENPPPAPILAPVKVSFKSSAYKNLQANLKP